MIGFTKSVDHRLPPERYGFASSTTPQVCLRYYSDLELENESIYVVPTDFAKFMAS